MGEEDAVVEEQKNLDRLHDDVDAQLAKVDRRLETPEAANRADAMAIRRHLLDRQMMLTEPGALCFGRIDTEDAEAFHIGRTHLEVGDLMLVNWRADVAAPFYQATGADPCRLRRRRSFLLDDSGRLVTDVEEETWGHSTAKPGERPSRDDRARRRQRRRTSERAPSEADPDGAEEVEPEVAAQPEPSGEVDEEQLRASDLLLRELARTRTGELPSIVATIQAEQDQIIRHPMDDVLVVQGGPGTGKSVVGLHRASLLLYRHAQEMSGRHILVAGPNTSFISYIAKVLPGLGDTEVRLTTFANLAFMAGSPTLRRKARVGVELAPEVRDLVTDPRMVQVVERAVEHRGRVPNADVTWGFERFILTLDVGRLAAELDRLRRTGASLHDIRRHLLGRAPGARTAADHGWVPGELWRSYESKLRAWDNRDEKAQTRLASAVAADPALRALVDEVAPRADPTEVVRDLLTDPEALSASADGLLTETEQATLLRPRPDGGKRFLWSEHELPLIGLASALIHGVPETFRHVVVDEAQDLSPVQVELLRRLASKPSFTVMGDLAQATGPGARHHRNWEDLTSRLAPDVDPTVRELTIGYRVPADVMALAEPVHHRLETGTTFPRSVRAGGDVEVERVASLRDGVADALAVLRGEPGLVGVIAGTGVVDEVRAAVDASGLESATLPGEIGDAAVVIVPPEHAKGLEFDHVLLVEPVDVVESSPVGGRLLFVALTRATNRLWIFHRRPLPSLLTGLPEEPEVEVEAPSEVPSMDAEDNEWLVLELEDLRAEHELLIGTLNAVHERGMADRRRFDAAVEAVSRILAETGSAMNSPKVAADDASADEAALELDRWLHPRDDDDWTEQEDRALLAAVDRGASPRELTEQVGRAARAVRRRLGALVEAGQLAGSGSDHSREKVGDGPDSSKRASGAPGTKDVVQLPHLGTRPRNPLRSCIGREYRRDEVPALLGLEFNPGNWRSGHVSLDDDTVLFVTLDKEPGRKEAEYLDRFDSILAFHWTSQATTTPDGKKGREILEAAEDGRRIHLFVRRRRLDLVFAYCGLVVPTRYSGEAPMTVWMRLVTPLGRELEHRFLDRG